MQVGNIVALHSLAFIQMILGIIGIGNMDICQVFDCAYNIDPSL